MVDQWGSERELWAVLSGGREGTYDALMASFVLCLLLGKKVKVSPSFRLRRLRWCHPWAEEAMMGALPARLSKERWHLKALKKRCTFGKGTPTLHLCFLRLFTCFLYPHRLSLELLNGGKCERALDIQKDSKGRETWFSHNQECEILTLTLVPSPKLCNLYFCDATTNSHSSQLSKTLYMKFCPYI